MINQLESRPKTLKGMNPNLIGKADGYAYSKIEFFVNNKNMYIGMSGKGVKKEWFEISDFRKYTALDIITSVDWGRHFESGVLKLWEEEGLEFGYTASIFRKL